MEPHSSIQEKNADSASPIAPSPTPSSSPLQVIWEWVRVIVVALVLAYIIRSFVAEPFIVEGASMDPTFATGQFLLVDRISYRFEDPQRYDVIVFQYPENPSIDYIKRIIGLPGDTMSMKNGSVTIVNKDNPKGFTLPQSFVSSSHQSYDTIPPTTLGPNQYFVMGDNRAQSSDSRVWGDVDRSLIIGRPVIRLLPPSVMPGQVKIKD